MLSRATTNHLNMRLNSTKLTTRLKLIIAGSIIGSSTVVAFMTSVDGTVARQETLRSSVIENAKMSNIYDFGRIGYRKDGTFAHKSRLDPENQKRFIEFIEVLKRTIDAENPGRNIKICPTLFTSHALGKSNSFFDLVTVFDPKKISSFDFPSKLLCHYLVPGEEINENNIYVIVNTAAFFTDVVTLSDVGEKIGEHEYLKNDNLIDVSSKFRYFRSNTMSDAQLKAVAELNLALDEFYNAEFPRLAQIYMIPAITFTPTLLSTTRGLFPVIVSILSAPFIYSALIGLNLGLYESKKREFLMWYCSRVESSQLRGLMTHLFRCQDASVQAKECVRNELMKPDIGSSSFPLVISDLVQEQIMRIPPRDEFVEKLISKCNERMKQEELSIEVDPYEVYKDDEGFDYVFIS